MTDIVATSSARDHERRRARRRSPKAREANEDSVAMEASSTKKRSLLPPLPLGVKAKTSSTKNGKNRRPNKKSKGGTHGSTDNGGRHAIGPPPLFGHQHRIPTVKPQLGTSSTVFAAVCDLLRSKRNIVVLNGAGVSVSCGIPDFRSKGSGLYESLDVAQYDGLSCAEDLFDYEVFCDNPQPFYQFAKHLYYPHGGPDEELQPSRAHYLVAQLEQHGQLLRVYTQNVDGLEEKAGVSSKKVCYAHGSLQMATCLRCKRKIPARQLQSHILSGTVPRCEAPRVHKASKRKNASTTTLPATTATATLTTTSVIDTAMTPTTMTTLPPRVPSQRLRARGRSDESVLTIHSTASSTSSTLSVSNTCGGVFKPDVTFFGQPLPNNVSRCLEADRHKVDAIVVMGTSLSVAPISKVIGYMPPHIPRILINRTIAHPPPTPPADKESNAVNVREGYVFDAYMLGNCDDVSNALAQRLFDRDAISPVGDDHGQLLSTMKADRDDADAAWKNVVVPHDRVLLFAGAEPPPPAMASSWSSNAGADDVVVAVRVTCDGCAHIITSTQFYKCDTCFDYDLCAACYNDGAVRQEHFGGQHTFVAETGAGPA